MSGGALDYAFSKVDTIIEDIDFLMKTDRFRESVSSMEAASLKVLIEKLDECRDGLRAAEWWLSGDTDSKPFLEWAKKHEI
jgi:hypothetical protein